MICSGKKIFARLVITVAVVFSGVVSAHTVWLESVDGQLNEFRVLFGGHAGKLETYDPEKLKTIDAKAADGKALSVEKKIDKDGVVLHVDGKPVLIAMHFDNGIFSYVGDSKRSIPKPMNEVPGATRGTWAVKYQKTIVSWSPEILKPLNQPFEVVLLDVSAPRANTLMRVQVLKDGQPVAGVRLGRGEEGTGSDPVTDNQGIAAFIPAKGFNKLWAGKRYAISDDSRFTQLSYEYLLTFTAE
jgi:nickel transport protein